MINNFYSFLQAVDRASLRTPATFTSEEYRLICSLAGRDSLCRHFMAIYVNDHQKLYDDLIRRPLNEWRDRQQEVPGHPELDVHDPIFTEARRLSRNWLKTQPFYTVPNAESYTDDKAVVMAWLAKNAATLGAEKVALLQEYIPFIFNKYQSDPALSRRETFFSFIAWVKEAAQTETETETAADSSREQEDRALSLLNSIYEAGIGRKGMTPMFPPHPYSCMPGFEERLLDTLTTLRLSMHAAPAQTPLIAGNQEDIRLEQENRQREQYAQHAVHPFISSQNLPTDLFFAAYLQVRFPRGFIANPIERQRLSLESPETRTYQDAREKYVATYSALAEELRTVEQRLTEDSALPFASRSPNRKDWQARQRNLSRELQSCYDTVEVKDPTNPQLSIGSDLQLAPSEAIAGRLTAHFDKKYSELAASPVVTPGYPIPDYLQSLILNRSAVDGLFELEGTEILPPLSLEQFLMQLSDKTGIEEEALASLCILAGGSPANLFASFEERIAAGEPCRISPEDMAPQLAAITEQLRAEENELSNIWDLQNAPYFFTNHMRDLLSQCIRRGRWEIERCLLNQSPIRLMRLCQTTLRDYSLSELYPLIRRAVSHRADFIPILHELNPALLSMRENTQENGATMLQLAVHSRNIDAAKIILELNPEILYETNQNFATVISYINPDQTTEFLALFREKGGERFREMEQFLKLIEERKCEESWAMIVNNSALLSYVSPMAFARIAIEDKNLSESSLRDLLSLLLQRPPLLQDLDQMFLMERALMSSSYAAVEVIAHQFPDLLKGPNNAKSQIINRDLHTSATLLQRAVGVGDLELVKRLLTLEPSLIYQVDAYDRTALEVPNNINKDMSQYLMDFGGEKLAKIMRIKSFKEEIRKRNVEKVQADLEREPDFKDVVVAKTLENALKMPSDEWNTSDYQARVRWAPRERDFALFEVLMDCVSDEALQGPGDNDAKRPILHSAAYITNFPTHLFEKLLERSGNLWEQPDDRGYTPLFLAVLSNNEGAVESILLRHPEAALGKTDSGGLIFLKLIRQATENTPTQSEIKMIALFLRACPELSQSQLSWGIRVDPLQLVIKAKAIDINLLTLLLQANPDFYRKKDRDQDLSSVAEGLYEISESKNPLAGEVAKTLFNHHPEVLQEKYDDNSFLQYVIECDYDILIQQARSLPGIASELGVQIREGLFDELLAYSIESKPLQRIMNVYKYYPEQGILDAINARGLEGSAEFTREASLDRQRSMRAVRREFEAEIVEALKTSNLEILRDHPPAVIAGIAQKSAPQYNSVYLTAFPDSKLLVEASQPRASPSVALSLGATTKGIIAARIDTIVGPSAKGPAR